MNLKKKAGLFLQGFAIFHILWFIAASCMQTPALPMPQEVYRHLPDSFTQGFHIHLLASLSRVFWGLFIALIIGLGIGILMGTSQKANRMLNPLIYFTYPIPKTALLPVVMILFGLGDGSKITLIVLITVFQVIVAVRDAVLHIDKGLYHVLKSLGATKWQMFIHGTLPAIMPELLTNMRLAVGTALSILFFAENYGTQYGAGYYIQDCWTRIDYIAMYGGILLLSLLGFGLFIAIDILEQVFCKGRK